MSRRMSDTRPIMHVGPETMMGSLLRQFWLPFYASEELEAGGPVARVRLLGEDLVVYRGTDGQVGLLGEHCSHRGASLFYARNEGCGLRCVWHGWMYDRSGSCVEMPNEPPNSRFNEKIHQVAYPCQERNGLVWAFMGPPDSAPELPLIELNLVPEENVDLTFRVQQCNYTQGIEGEYDSSHALILHQGLPGTSTPEPGSFRERVVATRTKNRYPSYQALDTDYGVLIGARYDTGEDEFYWRVYPFLMPFYTVINVDPTYDSDELLSGHAWVPMDDEHTLVIGFTWHPSRALTDDERRRLREGPAGEGRLEGLHPTAASYAPRPDQPFAQWWTKFDRTNNFGFDYEAQRRNERWSGIPGLWPQDSAVQEGFGSLPKRELEHLGSSDLGQIAIRRRLLRAAMEFADDGIAPAAAVQPDLLSLRPVEAFLPCDVTKWQEALEGAMRRVAGAEQGEAPPSRDG